MPTEDEMKTAHGAHPRQRFRHVRIGAWDGVLLNEGECYDITSLEYLGWWDNRHQCEASDVEGYSTEHYFSMDGRYEGADCEGIDTPQTIHSQAERLSSPVVTRTCG